MELEERFQAREARIAGSWFIGGDGKPDLTDAISGVPLCAAGVLVVFGWVSS